MKRINLARMKAKKIKNKLKNGKIVIILDLIQLKSPRSPKVLSEKRTAVFSYVILMKNYVCAIREELTVNILCIMSRDESYNNMFTYMNL